MNIVLINETPVDVGDILKKELAAISKALDDPRTDLSMTMVEIIQEMKTQLTEQQTNHMALVAQLERERDDCNRRLNDVSADWQVMHAKLDSAEKERDALKEIKRKLLAEKLEIVQSMPDLSPVIAWLENGCDPKEAAKELRIYHQRMRSNAKVRGDAPIYGAASLSTDGLCDEDRT